MTTLYLVRHGETDNNKAACFNGSKTDQPLNGRGLAQAASLAAPFAEILPDVIFSSPLRRGAPRHAFRSHRDCRGAAGNGYGRLRRRILCRGAGA